MKEFVDQNNILFSIIVVCKNEENVIGKTIQSIIDQTYGNFEIIVRDGNSMDNTVQVINEFRNQDKRIKLISEEDSGIYNAMNKAILQAEGEYLFFLNVGDAFYDKQVLSSIEKCIREKKPDIIVGGYLSKRHEQEIMVMPIRVEKLLEYVKMGNGVCHQSIFARRECLLEGFDERYTFSADFDWVCRQLTIGRHFVNSDTIIVRFDKYGVSSMAKNWKRVQDECKDIIQRHFQVDNEQADAYYKERYRTIKSQRMLECMNDFLALKQKNKSLSTYFEKHHIETIAIYGYHFLGQRLYEELKETSIKVKYIIDRNCTFQNVEIPLFTMENELEKVDAIVITPMFEYCAIREELKEKIDCAFLSIEDVINDMYGLELS